MLAERVNSALASSWIFSALASRQSASARTATPAGSIQPSPRGCAAHLEERPMLRLENQFSPRKSSREVHAVHEDILEIGMGGQGDVLDASRDALGAMALGLGEERHLGSQGRRIADIEDLRFGQGRDEPDAEG